MGATPTAKRELTMSLSSGSKINEQIAASKTKRQKARNLLIALLYQEDIRAEQVFAEARKLEICESIVRMAKKDLGIKAKHIGGASGYWTWSLPKSQIY